MITRGQLVCGRRKGGFTLIELLVVIAIIAILAAILFPVFASAKEAAKKTTSISNVRQIAMSAMLYAQNDDDRFFQTQYVGQAGLTTPDNFGLFRWPWLLIPYTKSMEVFRSPADTSELVSDSVCGGGCRDPKNPNYGYLWGIFPSYGFNWFNLAPDPSWDPSLPMSANDYKKGVGVSMTNVADPAATVMFADSVYGDPANPSLFLMGYFMINPPGMWSGAPPVVRSSYGFVWPRHNNAATVAYVDGHVRLTPIGKLKDPMIWDRD